MSLLWLAIRAQVLVCGLMAGEALQALAKDPIPDRGVHMLLAALMALGINRFLAYTVIKRTKD